MMQHANLGKLFTCLIAQVHSREIQPREKLQSRRCPLPWGPVSPKDPDCCELDDGSFCALSPVRFRSFFCIGRLV
jgi:hypothetical protein